MSETSAKSSTKKGFKAPILNVTETEKKLIPKKTVLPKAEKSLFKKNEEKSKSGEGLTSLGKKIKLKKSEVSLSDSQYEDIFKAVLKASTSQPQLKNEEKSNSGEDHIYPQKEKKVKKKNEEKSKSGKGRISPQKEKKLKKSEVSLSDSQYEDIFRAVLKASTSQPNTPIEEILEAVANSSEKSSIKGGSNRAGAGNSEGSEHTPVTPRKKLMVLPQLSPWGSHFSKQPSQASDILKQLKDSQTSTLLSPKTTSSSEEEEKGETSSSSTSGEQEEEEIVVSRKSLQQLSQHSGSVGDDKRKHLEHLQACRNVGVWVICDRISCQKQRYLPNVTDPQDLPDIWYCHMNPDPRHNSCESEEEVPSPEEEEDMIDNQFTAGSVVWARVGGFPWWPAMVDDDPDLECYYWLELDMRTVTYYHVVFFDKNEVTRAWVPIKDIISYKKNRNISKQRVMRGIDFSTRIRVAQQQAEDALPLTTAQRLRKYSFIARYKGPIPNDNLQAEKTRRKYKLKSYIGKKETGKRGRKRCADSDDVRSKLSKKKKKHNEFSKNTCCGHTKLTSSRLSLAFQELLRKKKGKKSQMQTESVEIDKVTMSVTATEEKNVSEMDTDHTKITRNQNCNVAEKASCVAGSSNSNIPVTILQSLSTKTKEIKQVISNERNMLNGISENLSEGISMIENGKAPQHKTVEGMEIGNESETPSGVVVNLEKRDSTEGESPHDSAVKTESETRSLFGSSLSTKSKLSEVKMARVAPQNTEDSLGSLVGPSQLADRGERSPVSHMEDDESQENKLSQSTIADFLAGESEDAVVPEASFSQQSEPFEE